MTKLQRLYEEQGQSPWLDNLTRLYLQDGSHGTLARLVRQGIRGVTANPTIFAKAIEGSDAYDQQFTDLIRDGCPIADAYWQLVTRDMTDAAAVLRPVFDASGGCDGFVSVEVAPELAHDTGRRSPRPGTCTPGSLSRTCSSRSRPLLQGCPRSRQ